MQKSIAVDKKKEHQKKILLERWKKVIETIERNKIAVIGEFLDEEVSPYMSIEEFAELINEEGYSAKTLNKYLRIFRNLYKSESSEGSENLSIHKQDLIASVEGKQAQDYFIRRAPEVNEQSLRDEINYYKKTGGIPANEEKGLWDMQLSYNMAVSNFILKIRELNRGLDIIIEGKQFDTLKPILKKQFVDRLKKIKLEVDNLNIRVKQILEHLNNEEAENNE